MLRLSNGERAALEMLTRRFITRAGQPRRPEDLARLIKTARTTQLSLGEESGDRTLRLDVARELDAMYLIKVTTDDGTGAWCYLLPLGLGYGMGMITQKETCPHCEETGWTSDREGGYYCSCAFGKLLESTHAEESKRPTPAEAGAEPGPGNGTENRTEQGEGTTGEEASQEIATDGLAMSIAWHASGRCSCVDREQCFESLSEEAGPTLLDHTYQGCAADDAAALETKQTAAENQEIARLKSELHDALAAVRLSEIAGGRERDKRIAAEQKRAKAESGYRAEAEEMIQRALGFIREAKQTRDKADKRYDQMVLRLTRELNDAWLDKLLMVFRAGIETVMKP
jgi:hypothetical protein